MKYFLCLSFLILINGCVDSYNGELIFVEPGVNNQFEYPYFLFIPNGISEYEENYLIIEPNNSGFVDDDLQKHIEKAKRIVTVDFYLGNWVAQKLKYPLIVPVFPRPKSEWKIYTHALDRDVMFQKGNSLERLDIQLLEMCVDAQKRLEGKNIRIGNRYLLTGFSASGTFANRFTIMHPEKILAVAAGGLNGLLMLPMDSINNEIVKYPVGTGDFDEITGKEFQRTLFLKTPQFYFMGRFDDNDAVPYEDAFDPYERDQIFNLLGEQMLPDRWDRCRSIYSANNVNAVFNTYDNIGHEHPELIKNDIIKFFETCIHLDRKR